MKKIFLFTITALFLSTNAFSQVNEQLNPLLTGVPSLTITPDARAGGMGDVGAATKPDENSQYWNPAKYAFMESEAGLSISYTPWLRKLIGDINLGYVAGYWRFSERNTLSASLRYFSLGNLELTDLNAIKYADVKPYELAFDVAYSVKLSESFSMAAVLRYIRSDLNSGVQASGGNSSEMYAGNAFAADIAAYYKKPLYFPTGDGNFGAGINISNIGTKISYDDGGSNFFIPTNLRVGASLDYPMDDYNRISVSADINKLLVPSVPRKREGESDNDFSTRLKDYYDISSISGIFKSFSDAPGGFKEEMREIMWGIGVEYAYNKQFFVRAGYFNENKYKGNRKFFTAGLGFKLNVFELNAGYVISVAQQNPLDQTLRLSLVFDLNGLKNLTY